MKSLSLDTLDCLQGLAEATGLCETIKAEFHRMEKLEMQSQM